MKWVRREWCDSPGDVVLLLDNVKPTSDYDVYLLLNKKKRGDSIKIEVKRDDQILHFAPVLVSR